MATAAELLEPKMVGFTPHQRARICALVDHIRECEGDIIGIHWCDGCKDRWAKICGLVIKFRKYNDKDREYAQRVIGIVHEASTHTPRTKNPGDSECPV